MAVSNFLDKMTEQWQDTASLVLGLWLLFSPWLLGYTGTAAVAWTAYVVGVIIAVAAYAALVNFQKWEEWLNAVLGAWLIISPWVLNYGGLRTAMWNHIVVGALVLILAPAERQAKETFAKAAAFYRTLGHPTPAEQVYDSTARRIVCKRFADRGRRRVAGLMKDGGMCA